MIKFQFAMFLALCLLGCRGSRSAPTGTEDGMAMGSIYDISIQDIDGNEVSLSQYRGQVMMIVNVASKCGFTGQYADLEALYEKYKGQGFVILGFPSNDFLWQEPGSNAEIKQFCMINYGVTFPMFAKISVKGRDKHPLYDYLTDDKTNPRHAGKITWNFNKFLVGRNGTIVARFDSRTKPLNAEVIKEIEAALSIPPKTDG